jgi:hypothetical protein
VGKRVEQWQREDLEVVDDLVEFICEPDLSYLFHEGIPLNAMALD